ncbi:MAG: ATP-grasp domain-containing protein [Acidobacteriota bacterium]
MTPIVLFGGRSDERHVSVASAQNVARTLTPPPPLCWFWTVEGTVHDVGPAELLAHQRPFEIDYEPSRPAIWPTLEQALDTLPVDDPVFVLALHGGEGEDGTVQRMMEKRGIAFTGSGSAASAAAFDKERARQLVEDRVPVAESRVVRDPRQLDEAVRDMLARHQRVVLKPVAGGSSRGLFFLGRGDAIPRVDIPYIVEQFLAGRELTVGVIDHDHGLLALPVIEIETDPGFTFDYAGKYLGTGTREICPAKIPDSLRDAAQRAAVAAHIALGCHGYSRTDLIATGGDEVRFLELNTLPGLTTSSLVPQELAEGGIGFRKFLERQIELARTVHTAR